MRIVELSGGVGGARLAVGLDRIAEVELTVVVNIGDDELIQEFHVSPDLDTVIYTLAGIQGPEGWGRAGDTFVTNTELARFGIDNTFRLGDLDLALNMTRTQRLGAGEPLSKIMADIARSFGVESHVLPASDDRIETRLLNDQGEWLGFQEYFVIRQHRDVIKEVVYDGADEATSAPGVIEAIERADQVVIGPSNPPLSIWPVLAIPGVRDAVESHPAVTAISPLIGGKALKGPAAGVMGSLGLPPGIDGVLDAYKGVIDRLIVDHADQAHTGRAGEVEVTAADTMIKEPERAEALARLLLGI